MSSSRSGSVRAERLKATSCAGCRVSRGRCYIQNPTRERALPSRRPSSARPVAPGGGVAEREQPWRPYGGLSTRRCSSQTGNGNVPRQPAHSGARRFLPVRTGLPRLGAVRALRDQPDRRLHPLGADCDYVSDQACRRARTEGCWPVRGALNHSPSPRAGTRGGMPLWCWVCSVTAPTSLCVACRPRSFSPVPGPGLLAMTHTECATPTPPEPSPGYPTVTPLRPTPAVPAATAAPSPRSLAPPGPHEIPTGFPGARSDRRCQVAWAIVCGSNPETIAVAGAAAVKIADAGTTIGCSAGGVIGTGHGVEQVDPVGLRCFPGWKCVRSI
jgi:hypothetical protein